MTSSGTLFAWTFERGSEKARVHVNGPLIANDGSLVLAAVRAGLGLGFMLAGDVATDIAGGRLIRVLTDWSSVCEGPTSIISTVDEHQPP